MFGFLRRKLFLFLLILCTVLFLKQNAKGIADTVEKWITGGKESRISQAVSQLIDGLSEGEGLHNAVEVFRETLQD